MANEKWADRYLQDLELRRKDPIAWLERILAKRKAQVEWIEARLKKLKEKREHGKAISKEKDRMG